MLSDGRQARLLYVLPKYRLELGINRREDIAAALKLGLATTVPQVHEACADPETGPHDARKHRFCIPCDPPKRSCVVCLGLSQNPAQRNPCCATSCPFKTVEVPEVITTLCATCSFGEPTAQYMSRQTEMCWTCMPTMWPGEGTLSRPCSGSRYRQKMDTGKCDADR